MPISPQDAMVKFGDAQGNVLKAHGREHSTFLFVELGDQANAREWVSQLLYGLSTGPDPDRDTVRITSAKKQLEDRQKRHQLPTFDAGLFTSLLFTAAGLQHLQVAALPQEATDQTPGQGRASAFAAGMRASATQQLLHDPASGWDAGWWAAPGQPTLVHAVLLLADDHPDRLTPAVNFLRERSVSLGLTVHVEQSGTRLVEDHHDIEHFGYADGVSQPLYLSDDYLNGPTPHALDTALEAEQLVFVPDALSPQPAQAWGSFMVFRKLQQNVQAFKAAEGEEEDNKDGLASTLGLKGDDRARAGAMIVGRFENGTPLVEQATEKPAVFTNNFDYHADTKGQRCPFHAHIRKVNPRTGDAHELRHRITRRGIPYGQQGEEVPDEEKGLLFVCYQRSIGQQFEFMQQSWANNAAFPFGHGTVGLDPIIGQKAQADHTPNTLTFPLIWDEPATKPADFAQHVTLKGGEYFYAPSMSGLAALAGVAPVLAS